MKNGLLEAVLLFLLFSFITTQKVESFEGFTDNLQSQIATIVNQVLFLHKNTSFKVEKDIIQLRDECVKSLISSYGKFANYSNITDTPFDKTDKFYMEKLINDSSYNKNDIGSFLPCMKRKPSNVNEKKTWNYLIAVFNHAVDLKVINTTKSDTDSKTTDTDRLKNDLLAEKPLEDDHNITINTSLYETKWKILGLCVSPGCTETEYATVIYFLDKYLDHFFQVHDISEVSTILIESNKLGYQFDGLDILRFIPCVVILVQLLMSMFGCFPYFLCKSCFKTNSPVVNNSEDFSLQKSDDSLLANPYFDKKEYLKFTTTFSLSRNSEELFGTGDETSTLNNDSGMTYLKGITGMNMIFLIFGAVFFILHLSPVSKINEIIFISFMRNFLFGIFFYGMRYAPKMLFSCSGFSLIYKLLCYFDECSLEEKEKNAGLPQEPEEEEEEEKDKSKMKANKGLINRESNADEVDEEEEKEYNDILFSSLFNFWKAQLHKYVILVLVMLFFKFSLYKLAYIFVNKGPLWEYFKRKVIDSPYSFDWPLIVSFIFGLHSFYVPEDCLDYFLNYQWMVYNEIIFFMISSFFIYIGYRYKIRVDIFFLSSMLAIIIMKVIVVFISSEYHSSLYYFFFKYWNIVSIPFFNYFYHVIGVLFGAANYVIQKDLSYKTAKQEEKFFLIPVIKILNILKKKSQTFIYLLGAIVAIIILGLSILQAIILQFSTLNELLNNHLEYFLSDLMRNSFLLFDTYIVVFLFHFSAFCFYLIGNNAINSFFSLKGWGILSKMYFSFILLVNLVILYFVYQSETQINFDIEVCILYSLICAVFSLLISCLFYISFELPYKRLVKLILKRLNKEEGEVKTIKKQFGEEDCNETVILK